MSQNEIVRIRVNNIDVGIVGLKETIADISDEFRDKPDNEIKDELFRRLSALNYISKKMRHDYENAFLREFKRYNGVICDEEPLKNISIKVLGSGCSQCDRLAQDLMQVLIEIDLEADIERITDITEIVKHSVIGVPALIINDEVKCVGSVPPKNKLVRWLTDVKEESKI